MADLNSIVFYGSLGILVLAAAAQFFPRALLTARARLIFWLSVVLVLGYASFTAYLQYRAFENGPLSFVLGTTEGLKWFVGYARLHFLNEYLVSLITAIVIALFAEYFNRRKGELFFEREELYIAALGIFLVGYPGFLFYIPLVLILSLLTSVFFVKRGERLPLYYFWMPTAIAVLLAVQFWAENQSWWTSFRF